MKKNRKNKTMLLALLVVAITSMTIVFAAMSTTLKIKGAGLVSTDAWNIKFENLASVTLKGAAQETTAPTIKSDTEIGDYVVVLKRTGDEVVYNFDIHNYGKLNAKIEELNIQTPVCTGNAEDEAQKIADAQIVSESLTYTLTYSDGEEVKVGDTLKAEEVKNLTLKLAYTGESMPSESVQITGLSVSIKYAQDMSEPEIPVEPVDPETIAGKRYDTETKVMIDDKVVTIPSGATISGLTGEYESVDDGIVMYVIPEGEEITDWNADTNSNGILDVQENYDQFVWIPVENAILDLSNNEEALSTNDNIKAVVQNEIDAGRYPMAIKKDKTNYFGVLYSYEMNDTNNEVKILPCKTWGPLGTLNREPDILNDSTNGDKSSTSLITKDILQEEFNIMIEKVSSNKGFWVGRYETSNMINSSLDDNLNRVRVIKGTIKGIRNITWYRMYAQQKKYSEIADISNQSTSSMIWGSQWDQIMIWMKNVKNNKDVKTINSYYILNSIGMGNYKINADGSKKSQERIEATGKSEDYKVKNIYDLAGNLNDWTLEAYSTHSRASRGGEYRNGTYGSYTFASKRTDDYSNSISHPVDYLDFNGSRMVLF